MTSALPISWDATRIFGVALLTAKRKLDEARFFLEKLRSSDLGSDEFKFYSSACASAIYGSLEHLLFDYAKKFWPSLDAEEYLNSRLFSLLAKATAQADATRFIQWYNKLPGRIESNSDTREVWKIRHTETHRDTIALEFDATLYEPMGIEDRLEFGVMRPSGAFEPSGSRPPPKEVVDAVQHSSVAVFLRGYRSKQLADVFGSAWGFVKSVLDEADRDFGSV